MAQNEPQRKETPPGPSPNSPSLLFEYQCRSGKVIRLAKSNRIEKKSIRQRESNRIDSKLFCPNWNALVHSCAYPCSSHSVARKKNYLIRPSFSIELRLVTDTASHMPIASTALAQRLAVKIVHTPVKCNNITITFYSFNNNSYVFD